MKKKLLLIGGGGHCKTVIEAVESMNYYDEIAIIDDDLQKKGDMILNYPIIGTSNELTKFKNEGYGEAFISLGSVGDPGIRISLYKKIKKEGFVIPTIINQSSDVSVYAEIEEGVLIGKHVTINADTRIGKCAILNTSCVVEHDCDVGEFVHIAPGAVLCGNVAIGKETHIGANAVIRQGLSVGEKAVIGLGSVVVKRIDDFCIAYGNPCQIIS